MAVRGVVSYLGLWGIHGGEDLDLLSYFYQNVTHVWWL